VKQVLYLVSEASTKGTMSRKGYYSPGLRRDLVTRLYHAARERKLPMTVFNDRLIEDALNRIAPIPSPTQSTAAVKTPALPGRLS